MDQAITIYTEGGDFSAYVVTPTKTPAPAVVVLHEIFGVNDDIRQTCHEFAKQGFISVAPELFWRQSRGVDLNAWSDEDWRTGLALYAGYDRDVGVRDAIATMRAAQQLEGATRKVGLVGFCLGGLLAYLIATRHKPDAAVAYHGGDTEKYLDEAHNLTAPLLMHLAEEDEFISEDAQKRIKAVMADLPNTRVFSYPGQKHAFARHTGKHYDANAATLAADRTVTFLAEHLSLDIAR